MTTQKIISLVPMLFIVCATITGWVRFKRLSPSARIFAFAWTLVFLVDAAGHITGYFKINNQWFYNIFFLLWFCTLAIAYRAEFAHSAIRKAILIYLVLLPPLFLLNVFYLQGNRNLQSLFFVVGGCFIIFLALTYLRQLYNSEENEKIQNYSFFWFSIGLLFYFSINVLYFGMYNSLISKVPAFNKIYHLYISNGIIILLNICVTKGFLCLRRSLK